MAGLRIIVDVIPHDKQRYPTCGDWVVKNPDTLHISVSETGDRNYNALIAIHELTESVLCIARGITAKEVDKFDMAYEAKRIAGDDSEPGDDSMAPYKRQHCFATGVERLVAAELGVDWKTYEETLDAL